MSPELREQLIKTICEHTGWLPDWNCTVRLADAIEALEEEDTHMITFNLGVFNSNGGKP